MSPRPDDPFPEGGPTADPDRRIRATRVEVEAELLAGDAALLRDLVAAFANLPGVGPASSSKLAFALAARAARPD